MGNGKRKSMSFIAISLLLIFFLSGIYFIYTLVHNWDEFREPIALYTIETEEHKYYVRNNAIYDESGKKIEELTQIYLSLLNKKIISRTHYISRIKRNMKHIIRKFKCLKIVLRIKT